MARISRWSHELALAFILALAFTGVEHEDVLMLLMVFGIWRRRATAIRRVPALSRVVAICLAEVTPVTTAVVDPGSVAVGDIAVWRAAEDAAPVQGSTAWASPTRYCRIPRKC